MYEKRRDEGLINCIDELYVDNEMQKLVDGSYMLKHKPKFCSCKI